MTNSRKVRFIDSHANFAMLQTDRPATEVIEHFRKNNVLIARLFPSMNTYVRVYLFSVFGQLNPKLWAAASRSISEE